MHPGDLFLDSCIFLSRAIGREMEHYYEDCDCIITSDLAKYTGTAVKKELDEVLKRREDLYTMLMTHIATGESPRTFDMSRLKGNDELHFKKIMKQFDKMGTSAVRSKFIRQLSLRIKANIPDSLTRVKMSNVELENQDYFIDYLKRMNVTGPDARILFQYISWGRERNLSSFITTDGDHVLRNRDGILETAYTQFSFPEENMRIQHARDVAALIKTNGL
jgi:hypothetical protein